MVIEQLYTNCLSEAAYFIADNGEAAVIDPIRDIDTYIKLAKKHNATIKYVFETHFHADFLSGHLDLARETGAAIIFGPSTKAHFKFHEAKDNEVFELGKIKIKALHTPGHTPESTCYLLYQPDGKAHCLFSGDTLFVGDVGRPDLLGTKMSKEDLAGLLFDSLENKIKPLADDVILYPAHGPGSACGKQLGAETVSTIGAQKATNYALQFDNKKDFIKAITTGLNAAPVYFPLMAQLNAKGYANIDDVVNQGLQKLSPKQVEDQLKKQVFILDSRNPTEFTQGFVPSSVNIGLNGRFAEWAGKIIPYDQDILLVTDPGKEKETTIRLARVGFEKIIGHLDGGYEAWKNGGHPIDLIIDIEPDELAMDLPFDKKLEIIDVRQQQEFMTCHIEGAHLLPLDELVNPLIMAQVDDEKNLFVHCAGGYRSVIACSLMKKEGFHNLKNVLEGFKGICEQENIPLVRLQKNETQQNEEEDETD